jgi:two-component system, NtrC family, response regulator HydG
VAATVAIHPLTSSGSAPRVLVVDDDPAAVRALALMLGSDGFSVETCVDGAEACALLRRETFDAILTDLDMPGMDGRQLLEATRDVRGPAIVLVVSAYSPWQSEDAMKELGVRRHFMKPLDYEALLDELVAATGFTPPSDGGQ